MAYIMYDNSKRTEDKLAGIIPQHYTAYQIFKSLRFLAILVLIIAVAIFSLKFIDNPVSNRFVDSMVYKYVLIGVLGFLLLFLLLMLLIHLIFLRKPKFDFWVYEFAQKHLGTEVIYYNSKCLYIQYNRASTKEVNKEEFVQDMSAQSEHYSYYYNFKDDTYIDLGVIRVTPEKKSPIPDRASFKPEDDEFFNFVPIGLTVNNATKSISPIGWYINNNNVSKVAMKTEPSVSILICGGTGSGKSVLEQGIVGHVSRWSDKFQLVGMDCKRVEFNLLRGVKGVKAVALDVQSSAQALAAFQKLMMDRFKFMEDMQVNNVYNIKDKEVDYYELWGEKYQFDEIFEVFVDINDEELGRNATKIRAQYPDGRMPKITTIDKIYEGLEDGSLLHPQLPTRKGHDPFIKKGDIKKTRGIFNPKILLFLADELNEFSSTDDYQSLEVAKTAMGSIARLGRAAGCHLALAMQRAASGTVSGDLMNNIQQSIVLGGFDSGISSNMFEKDISHLAKPEIKGRAFMQVGKKVLYEVQTYYTQPEKDWVFDEELRDTIKNPEWQKQKFGEVINDDLVRLNQVLREYGFKTDDEMEQEKIAKLMEDPDEEEEIIEIDEDDDDDEEYFSKSRDREKQRPPFSRRDKNDEKSRKLDKLMSEDDEDDDSLSESTEPSVSETEQTSVNLEANEETIQISEQVSNQVVEQDFEEEDENEYEEY